MMNSVSTAAASPGERRMSATNWLRLANLSTGLAGSSQASTGSVYATVTPMLPRAALIEWARA